MDRIFIFIFLILLLPLTNAFDNETIQICGGDEETLILCIGDLENSPIGKNIYTASGIIDRTGGAGTGGTSPKFDNGLICNMTNRFLLENVINETTKEMLLLKINNESEVIISQSVLNEYIDNFEIMCNMTIVKEKEIIEKVVFPFILILCLALLIFSYYHRKKIIKFIVAFFDDDEESDLSNDLKR